MLSKAKVCRVEEKWATLPRKDVYIGKWSSAHWFVIWLMSSSEKAQKKVPQFHTRLHTSHIFSLLCNRKCKDHLNSSKETEDRKLPIHLCFLTQLRDPHEPKSTSDNFIKTFPALYLGAITHHLSAVKAALYKPTSLELLSALEKAWNPLWCWGAELSYVSSQQ